MKRLIACMLAALLCLGMAACGETSVSVDLEQVKGQMMEALAAGDPLEVPAERLTDLYTIAAEDVKASVCLITMGGAFPDEIIVVEAVDSAAAQRIAEKLENRLADVTNQAQNYDAESFALLKQCKVNRAGNYVTLFISAKSAQLQTIFDGAKK